MVKILKNHVYVCAFTTAIFSFLHNVTVCARVSSDVPNAKSLVSRCGDQNNQSSQFDRCKDGQKHIINGKSYQLTGASEKEAPPVLAIVVENKNTIVHATDIKVKAVPNSGVAYGVGIKKGGTAILDNPLFEGLAIGVGVLNGTLEMNGGVINAKIGVQASEGKTQVNGSKTSVFLKDTQINASNEGVGLTVFNGATAQVTGGAINAVNAGGVDVDARANVVLDNVRITSKSVKKEGQENASEEEFSVFSVQQGGSLQLKRVNVNATDVNGLWIESSSDFLQRDTLLSYLPIVLLQENENKGSIISQLTDGIFFTNVEVEDSAITVRGDQFKGLYLESGANYNNRHDDVSLSLGSIQFKNSSLSVPKGIAIYSDAKRDSVIGFLEGTSVSGDLLLQVENDSSVVVFANDATLTGGVRIDDESTAEFIISESKWTLRPKKKKDLTDSILNSAELYDSLISKAYVQNSRIIFEKPTSKKYQTLHVGKEKIASEEGQAAAGNGQLSVSPSYSAAGDARIYVNAFVSGRDSSLISEADRILIHGDVVGATTIYVSAIEESLGQKGRKQKGNRGVSLVQVSGKAHKDSFVLDSDYVTLNS
ncbi:hypothetical protein NPY00_05945, partial [Bartonella sp. F2]|nr:hypothetical protein [Bartonella sp. F02]